MGQNRTMDRHLGSSKIQYVALTYDPQIDWPRFAEYLLYQRGKFADDRARVERLFAMYETLIAAKD